MDESAVPETDRAGAGAWVVTHVGARDHYVAARGFHRQGCLGALVTDIWMPGRYQPLASVGGQRLRRLSRRFHPELRGARVRHFTWRTLKDQWVQGGTRGGPGPFQGWIEAGRTFGRRAATAVCRNGFWGARQLAGYTCASLELLETCRAHRVTGVHMQVDAGEQYYLEQRLEWERHPGAETEPVAPSRDFLERIRQEWTLAAQIVVNSDYAKRALEKQGVAAGKLRVVPLCYEPASRRPEPKELDKTRPLHVLWMGNVCLVKGFYYFYEAAQALAGSDFTFTAAGTVRLRPEFARQCASRVTFTGQLSPAEVNRLYSEAHVLVFPTLSDGFGLVQLEALGQGLPVIATPHCGQVVTDGLDGFVVPVQATPALVDRLAYFRAHPLAYREASAQALEKSRAFQPDRYTQALTEAIA